MKQLGRKFGILALCAALVSVNAAPAFARGVGVDVDGRTYTFSLVGGGGASYEIDGKTFIVGEDTVIVRESGKPERRFALGEAVSADESATDAVPGEAEECVSEVIVTSDGDAEGVHYIIGDGAIAQEGTSESAYYISEDGVIIQGATAAEDSRDDGNTRGWSAEEAAEFDAFAPYGLSCDAAAGKLYYLGEPVRVFEDEIRVESGTAEIGYFDAEGTVDVRSIRDARGNLTGLEALSAAEFAARDLREWTNPAPAQQMESTATDGSEPTPAERAAFFAPYAPFGLRYDAAANQLYANGRPVREFLDVRSSNGESPAGGKFHGSMTSLRFDGEVDVTILRDYSQPDANGEGRIIGIEVTEVKG